MIRPYAIILLVLANSDRPVDKVPPDVLKALKEEVREIDREEEEEPLEAHRFDVPQKTKKKKDNKNPEKKDLEDKE